MSMIEVEIPRGRRKQVEAVKMVIAVLPKDLEIRTTIKLKNTISTD